MGIFSNIWKPRQGEAEETESADGSIRFGPIVIPAEFVTQHFLALASTGGGKTTILRLMLQDILPDISQHSDCRLLMTNPKRDAMSILHGIAPTGVKIETLDPFDARSFAWNVARDVKDPKSALQFAMTLIPNHQQSSQPFFRNAAQHLLYGVLLSFLRQGVEWRLSDLIRAVRGKKTLKSILQRCDDSKHLLDQYFEDDRLLSNILSTLATLLLPFEPVAAAWDSASDSIAMEDWVKEESVLVLGSSDVSRAAVDVINRCIFKRVSDLTLDQSESRSRRTYFMFDEVSECAKLDGLVSLLKRGRSKGAAVILAAQSIAGLRDTELYGQHGAAEILGQIQNKFFGRLECPETAKWCSEVIGQQEVRQVTESGSTTSGGQGGGTSSRSWNEQYVTRAAVMESQLMSLPPCNDTDGLAAYYMTGIAGTFQTTMNGQQLFHNDLIPPSKRIQDFVPRDIESQYLKPWTKEQRAVFIPDESFNDEANPKQQDEKPEPPDLDRLDEI